MAMIDGRHGAWPGRRERRALRRPSARVRNGNAKRSGRSERRRSLGSDHRSSVRSSAGSHRDESGERGGGVACGWVGSSWQLLLIGRELALGMEFVAQVVQRVGFSIALRAEGGACGGGEVAKVGQRAGQALAEPSYLGGQDGDQVERASDLAPGRGAQPQVGEAAVPCCPGGLVVGVGYLL